MFRYSPNENKNHNSIDKRLYPTDQVGHCGSMQESESRVEHKRNSNIMAINMNIEY